MEVKLIAGIYFFDAEGNDQRGQKESAVAIKKAPSSLDSADRFIS